MPWEAIKYVGSGLTLAAFIVAAIAWILKSKSEERERLIDLAKEDERADLVRDALEFFRVDTAGLTKAQQYQLALEQIRERAQRFKIIAIVVCIVAVLGTAVAIYTLTRPSRPIGPATDGGPARNGDTQLTNRLKEAQTLLGDARLQFNTTDFAGAWKTVEQATALIPDSDEARKEQVDMAMAWVRGWRPRSVSQAAYDLIDNKLALCLEEAAARADGVRAADIHAHLGWANYLRRIENVPVEEEFKKAVKLDPANPFAHAMWGYWLIADAQQSKEGKAHFESAFKSGREKEFVRELQLDTWLRYPDTENSLELILVLDDMRKKGETRTVDSRQSLFSGAYGLPDSEFLQRFKTILPAADHLATFQWLTEGFRPEENVRKGFFLAELTEAAGDPAKALAMYRVLLAEQLTGLETEIKEGIKRTQPGAEKGASEASLIIAQAKAADAATRVKLIRSLAIADIDVAEALPALVAWAQDPDHEVLAAACDTLVQIGRPAVPQVIPLLSSDKRNVVGNAATILGKIGLEPKLAVPALTKALENPDADVRGKAIEALQSFGPDAEPAVAALLQTLTNAVQTDLQRQIAYTLGEIGPAAKDAVPQLIELLKSNKDREGHLNVVAADALGKIGPAASNAVPALIVALKSDDVQLPTRAEEALGNIGAGAKAAIPALIEALRFTEKQHWDNCTEPVGKIAEALANRGDTSSLPVLKKAMASLEAANVEPKYITPVREAVDTLKERESGSNGK